MNAAIIYLISSILLIFCDVSQGDTNNPTPFLPYYSILKSRYTEGDEIQEDKVCSIYFQNATIIAKSEAGVTYHNISNGFDWDVCNDANIPPDLEVKNRFVFLEAFNLSCTFLEQAIKLQELGAYGVIFARNSKSPRLNQTYAGLNFAMISNLSSWKILNHIEDDVVIGIYTDALDFHVFNKSLLIIWFLAMFTVSVGSFWSGIYRYDLWISSTSAETKPVTIPRPSSNDDIEPRRIPSEDMREVPKPYQEETSLNVSPRVIVFFVTMMCAMLLSLYFLYDYLVYIIITLFCIASCSAVFCCLYPLVKRIPCRDCRTPYFNVYFAHGTLEVRQILLFLFSLTLVIVWVVLRKEPYAWVLQDILGIAFSINMLKMIRLTNLKICTILLTLLFFYDIFFVFITPLFTSNGNSIMVDVAQGGDSGEQLPMVLMVPHFEYPEVDYVCNNPYAYNLLGFGDLLVPGLLVSFAHFFDLKAKTPYRLYFVFNMFFYGVGLVVTFIVLYLMRYAQPALLYLVPCTILPTVIIAACRGELNAMWQCQNEDKQIDDNEAIDEDAPSPQPQ